MSVRQVTRLTIPLFPYIQPDKKEPIVTKRIRPQDSLDLSKMMDLLRPSEICSLNINGAPWSVLSVFSPYSPKIHVMVMETSVNRYLPSPDRVPDLEGDALIDVWRTILTYISTLKGCDTVHVGYNWSPRSWGMEEEKTGFQSIPTKWHAMLWGWPNFISTEQSDYIDTVDLDSLSLQSRRLIGENDYAIPLGMLIRNRLESAFPEGSELIDQFPLDKWRVDRTGLTLNCSESIVDLLRTPYLFSQILKPVSAVLDQVMIELCEIMTDMRCAQMDRILMKTEQGLLDDADINTLRRSPNLCSTEEIASMAKDRNYPAGLIDSLLSPIEARCAEKGDPSEMWRKGFGYALVLSGSGKTNTATTTFRIMPGVYLGSGGVVEALGVVLHRPEDRTIDQQAIERKSGLLWELKTILHDKYDLRDE